MEAEADRINWRFQADQWKPIVFLEPAAQPSGNRSAITGRPILCLVTSLHDGMNLVAKEFVAARHDERGVLILSRFTGAARELRDALSSQSVRHRPDRRSDSCGSGDALGRKTTAHAAYAQDRAGTQRLSLGRSLIGELCEVRLDNPEAARTGFGRLFPDSGVRDVATKEYFKDFLEAVARAPRSVLLLDYDGTLAPFSVDRQRRFLIRG